MSIFKRQKEKEKQAEVNRLLRRGCMYCAKAQDGQVGNFYIECWCPTGGGYVISMDEAVIDMREFKICPHFVWRDRNGNEG